MPCCSASLRLHVVGGRSLSLIKEKKMDSFGDLSKFVTLDVVKNFQDLSKIKINVKIIWVQSEMVNEEAKNKNFRREMQA
jgi:hypothetical protein